MALDTKDKRGSSIGTYLPQLRTLPDPNTDIDTGDRVHTAFSYRGVVPVPPPVAVRALIFGSLADANKGLVS